MQEFLHGAGVVCLYFIMAVALLLPCRRFLKIPDELFRKILHFLLLGSYIPFIFCFSVWWRSAVLIIGLEVLLYPILAWAEHFMGYSELVTERKSGELKQSLLLAFTMLAVCVAICWGWLGDRYLVLACMYAWGVGDAFAALVGKKFGKHKIHLKHTSRKSAEGSLAMFVTSALAILTVLLLRGIPSPAACVLVALCGAAAVTIVELFTPGGFDTVTCPTAAMLAILPLIHLLGGFA